MTKAKNIEASVRQRLLNLSKEQGEDFGLVLSRFAIERLLYRVAASPYKGQFILKGATLFTVWSGSRIAQQETLTFWGLETIRRTPWRKPFAKFASSRHFTMDCILMAKA
jgi:hypothetical protein